MTQQIDKQNIIKKIIGNDFVYSETISPLSNLCQYLINKKISSKKDWFIFHNKFLEVFIAQYKPTIDQLTFIRAVSLNTIFKDNGFPKIGNFASDEVDNIRFEPILNKNLLLINRDCLQNLMKEPDVELKKLAVTELNIIEKEIARIDNIINRVPDILTKDLSGGLKKVNGKPKVTVITASYNLASMVEETIRSVANQNYDSFEHIVIDGASTDGSVEILKKYPNIILVSEKDHGPEDAYWKGLRLAKGDYIMTCYISDGYSNVDWIRKCAEALDKNKDVSLIWGIPWSIDRNSHMINARFTEFDYTEQPQREELFYCWMKTGLSAVETNLCVRKEVLLECYPTLKECEKDILDWQEFTFRFNSRGYLALHIPVIANYSHIDHEGKYMMRLKKSGKYKRQLDTYNLNMSNYIKSLVLGSHIHKFIDSHGNILPIKFDRKRVIVDYIKNKIKKNKKYIQPSKYVAYVKKLW